jgi:hypothetical protein
MSFLRWPLIVSCLAIIHGVSLASDGLSVWQQYFPATDCQTNECARQVPGDALAEALSSASYLTPQSLASTIEWIFLVDMTQHSSFKRGYLISMKTGEAETFHVAHGRNSGDSNGNAIRFSNRNNSKMSSLGLYGAAESYRGKHGYSLRLDGLEPSNSNARKRAIVLHSASYMTEDFIKKYGRAGRSWGCPAIAPDNHQDFIDRLKNGNLLYIYYQ